MTQPADLCPWLGLDEDRELHFSEPSEVHACYARKPPADIKLEHQAAFCLAARHPDCPFYRQPPAPEPPPQAVTAEEEVEDEIGPAPRRFSLLQVALWGAVLIAAGVLLYVYASTLLNPQMALTSSDGGDPSVTPSPTASQTATPQAAVVTPLPTYEFGEPTATPTPYPGGAIYSLSPPAGAVGWVASDESRGNHLGDSYLYAGVFDDVIYHGIFQIDLSRVPRGATIHAGVLELAGLDARRMNGSGVWEVRLLGPGVDEDWSRTTFQDVHNATVEWSLSPALGVGDLVVGATNAFVLPREVTRDLEGRVLGEHYVASFRIDGPLAGENRVFAWDSGFGSATRGGRPRLLLNVGPAPLTAIPSGSPPPTGTPTATATPTATETPEWVVVTSTPTPGNAVTAAAVAVQETVWATTTGTYTPMPEFVATATPDYIVVTNTPRPENYATASLLRAVATANVLLTGTSTPTPHNLVTATPTPQATRTPVLVWLDQVTPLPTVTPTPTPPPIPKQLRRKILFLSDRTGREEVYVLDPGSRRVALLTERWPYELALESEDMAPDGQAWVFVKRDGSGKPQVYVYSDYYGGDWQVTFNTGLSYDPVWSPKNELIAFVSTEEGNDDIYVVGVDGKDQRRLTINQWEWDKHPSWSPDGKQIVYWSNVGSGRRQIWIMNADGTGQRPLLDSDYDDWDPVWVK